jgi:hypothetical protein
VGEYHFLRPVLVNTMNKIAKEKFENNLDNFLLNNSSNPKMYWKIMKMLIKSNKGNYCISLLNHGLSFSRINIVFPDGIHALEI